MYVTNKQKYTFTWSQITFYSFPAIASARSSSIGFGNLFFSGLILCPWSACLRAVTLKPIRPFAINNWIIEAK